MLFLELFLNPDRISLTIISAINFLSNLCIAAATHFYEVYVVSHTWLAYAGDVPRCVAHVKSKGLSASDVEHGRAQREPNFATTIQCKIRSPGRPEGSRR